MVEDCTYRCAQISTKWRTTAQVSLWSELLQAPTSICTPNVISKVTPMPEIKYMSMMTICPMVLFTCVNWFDLQPPRFLQPVDICKGSSGFMGGQADTHDFKREHGFVIKIRQIIQHLFIFQVRERWIGKSALESERQYDTAVGIHDECSDQ